MRLPLLPPERLSDVQRTFYDRALKQIEGGGFTAFKTRDQDGALLGPWGVFIHAPEIGQAHYDQVEAISAVKTLPEDAKQVAILAVGAHYRAAYELYAHAATAAREGMDPTRIATLAAGERPLDLDPAESAAFDVARALVGGGVLPGPTYATAREVLGDEALYELVMLIGLYAQVSLVLNAFDVPSEHDFTKETPA